MSAPIPPPDIDWVPLGVFGTPGATPSGFGARLELAVTVGAGAAAPFVSLSRGRFSNVWLGRIAFQGTPVRYVAIKAARDNYVGEAGSGLASPFLDNREVAEMWEREKDALLAMQRQGAVQVFGFEADGPFASPTVFCDARRLFFRPIDPDALEPLVACRDGARLAALGLGDPERSLARYLATPTAPTDGAVDRVATWSTVGSAVQARSGALRAGDELFHAWAGIFQRELDFAATARLEANLPCWYCGDQSTCFGGDAPAVAERVSPLSFYGGPAIVADALPLHVDEAAAIVGGAAIGDLFPASFGPGMVGRQLLLHDVDRRISDARTEPGSGFWRAGRGAADHAREVLFLKLDLLRRLASIVRRYHENVRRPLFDLSPATFMVDFARGASATPFAWTLVPELVDTGAQHRYRPSTPLSPDLPAGWVPSLDVDPLFTPSWVPPTAPAWRVRMVFTVGQTGDHGDIREVRLRGQPKGQVPVEVRCGDFVQIVSDNPLPALGGMELVGVVEELADGLVRLRILPGEPIARRRGELPVHFEGEAVFFPRFTVTADLLGFALLAVRVLLWNDRIDAPRATEVGRQLFEAVRYRVAERMDGTRRFALETVDEFRAAHEALADPSHVLFHERDRIAAGAAIDTNLWRDVVRTLASIGTLHPEFGFAADRSDVDPERPERLFERVEAAILALALRARDAMVPDHAMDREFVAACDALLGGAATGGTP